MENKLSPNEIETLTMDYLLDMKLGRLLQVLNQNIAKQEQPSFNKDYLKI